jgi:hypothetical protein
MRILWILTFCQHFVNCQSPLKTKEIGETCVSLLLLFKLQTRYSNHQYVVINACVDMIFPFLVLFQQQKMADRFSSLEDKINATNAKVKIYTCVPHYQMKQK